MRPFKYVGKDKSGKDVSGFMEVEDKDTVIRKLHEREIFIVSIEETERSPGDILPGTFDIKGFLRVASLDDIAIVSRQLSTIINAGLPLFQGLDIIAQQVSKKGFKRVLSEVRDDVETGVTFSSALEKHPKVFSKLYVSMVRAGEKSGMLDVIMVRLADYLEYISKLQRKIKSAMMYPIVISFIALLVTLVLLVKVVPSFRMIFDDLGGVLPLPTQILILVSDGLQNYFFYVLTAVSAMVMLLVKYAKTTSGRWIFDRIKITIPVFGTLFKKVAIEKFSRTLAILIKSGVPILDALEIVAKTTSNIVIEDAILNARVSIGEGESIAGPLSEGGVFPPMVIKMISVGEETGALEEMLNKIADFYGDQVETAVSGLTSLVEPVMISVLGIVIGSIVMAIFLPMFRMVHLVQM